MATMFKSKINKYLGAIFLSVIFAACTPTLVSKKTDTTTPPGYNYSQGEPAIPDSTNTAHVRWREFFTDPNLIALIDTALKNNQELNITLQEIEIARNEVRARKGEYLPFVDISAGAGVEKVGRYTGRGAMEATTEIEPGTEMPEPLQDYQVGLFARWEVDIWNKLHNAKKAAAARYLSTIEGRNFMVTQLVAEIANSYYELMALDNQLEIVTQNIEIQSDALEMVKAQKEAARVTELAVRRFQAQVLNTTSLQYNIRQQIIETENRLNFLLGRYPQSVPRNSSIFPTLIPDSIRAGIPSQLLANRPDVKQAEFNLVAAKLDVNVAKARFYPSFGISAGVGFQAFNPSYLLKTPESLLYSLAGDLVAPLVNRNAIKAAYYSANAGQIQAIYNYERTILNAYVEVANQLSKINNLKSSYDLKEQEVQALNQSVTISNDLFISARADYMEVLLTQREALDSKFELIETKMKQMHAWINIYQALGGGWN
jgi:NodT family efflux transporter outer membrane factor (OMF) lipoprotein